MTASAPEEGAARVQLSDVVEQLEMLGEESAAYLNKQTGELYMMTEGRSRSRRQGQEAGAGSSSRWSVAVRKPQRGCASQPRVAASATLGKR
jgi:hypothetical protein